MSKEIQPGDLVMVVRPARCCGRHGGKVFVVFRLLNPMIQWPDSTRWTCPGCRATGPFNPQTACFYAMGLPEGDSVPVDRLIRIDPPALPESVTTEREVLA